MESWGGRSEKGLKLEGPWHQDKKLPVRGWPGGTVVKFARYASVARGSPVRIPLLGKPCCGRRPTYKLEEDEHGCLLRANLPQQ